MRASPEGVTGRKHRVYLGTPSSLGDPYAVCFEVKLSVLNRTEARRKMPEASAHAAYQHNHLTVLEGKSTSVDNETRKSFSTWTDAHSLARGQCVLRYLWADVQLRAMSSLYQWQASLGVTPTEITSDERVVKDGIVTRLMKTSETGTGTLSVSAQMPQDMEGGMDDDLPVINAWGRREGVTFVITARFEPAGDPSAESTSLSATFTYTCFPASCMRRASTLRRRRRSRSTSRRRGSDPSLRGRRSSTLSSASSPPS